MIRTNLSHGHQTLGSALSNCQTHLSQDGELVVAVAVNGERQADQPSWRALGTFCFERGVYPRAVQVGCARAEPKDAQVVVLRRVMPGFRMDHLGAKDYRAVRSLLGIGEFVPKVGWRRPLSAMVVAGLETGLWQAVGLRHRTGKLAAYLDFRELNNGAVEIGTCISDKQFRGNGFSQQLLSCILLTNYDRDILIGTWEGNATMRHIVNKLGFELQGSRLDRIDGQHSLYYRRRAFASFGSYYRRRAFASFGSRP